MAWPLTQLEGGGRMAPVEARRPHGVERWADLGGILYVVLFIGGVLLAFSGTPNGDAARRR